MRQVFTSLRIETVEGVAKLLQDADIEVHIANGRSYHSKRGSQFSYAEPMQLKQQPSLWVKRAEDQPRAREILRGAGLLASTRQGQPAALLFTTETPGIGKRRSLAWKIRVALLVAIAIAALVTVVRHRAMPPPPATPASATENAPTAAPDNGLAEDEVRIRIPNAPLAPVPAPDPGT